MEWLEGRSLRVGCGWNGWRVGVLEGLWVEWLEGGRLKGVVGGVVGGWGFEGDLGGVVGGWGF